MADPDLIEAIRQRHVKRRGTDANANVVVGCPECGQSWPCDTAVLLSALDEERNAHAVDIEKLGVLARAEAVGLNDWHSAGLREITPADLDAIMRAIANRRIMSALDAAALVIEIEKQRAALDEERAARIEASMAYVEAVDDQARLGARVVELEAGILQRDAAWLYWRAEVVRAGGHDLMPYDDPEHGYTDPLDDREQRQAVRSVLARIVETVALVEAPTSPAPTTLPPGDFCPACAGPLDDNGECVRANHGGAAGPAPTTEEHDG